MLKCDFCQIKFDPKGRKVVRGSAHRKYCCEEHRRLYEDMLDRISARSASFTAIAIDP
jgi:hypothetical protein